MLWNKTWSSHLQSPRSVAAFKQGGFTAPFCLKFLFENSFAHKTSRFWWWHTINLLTQEERQYFLSFFHIVTWKNPRLKNVWQDWQLMNMERVAVHSLNSSSIILLACLNIYVRRPSSVSVKLSNWTEGHCHERKCHYPFMLWKFPIFYFAHH